MSPSANINLWERYIWHPLTFLITAQQCSYQILWLWFHSLWGTYLVICLLYTLERVNSSVHLGVLVLCCVLRFSLERSKLVFGFIHQSCLGWVMWTIWKSGKIYIKSWNLMITLKILLLCDVCGKNTRIKLLNCDTSFNNIQWVLYIHMILCLEVGEIQDM